MHKSGRFVCARLSLARPLIQNFSSQRALNGLIGGDPDGIFLIVSDMGSLGGQGLDFVDGMLFLERFYSVYGELYRDSRALNVCS